MTRFVLDAPTLVHLTGGGPLPAGRHQLVAPNKIRTQALELLLDAVNRGELTERAALAQHDAITGLKMRLLGDRGSRDMAWRLARRHDWPNLDDAEYLAVTLLQADALVTVDPRMAQLASGIVAVEPVAALYAG